MIKLKFTGLFFVLLISLKGLSQDSLVYYKSNNVVTQNDTIRNMDNLFTLMRPQKETFKRIESARDCFFFSNLFYILGGFPLGYSIGSFLVTQKMNWILFGAGAGLFTGGVILNFRGKNKVEDAVNSYNNNLGLESMNRTPLEFSFGVNQYGLAMNFKF